MYANVNCSIAVRHEIISKIKEIIDEGCQNLKSFVNSEKYEFDIYQDLDNKFDDIANNLRDFDYFQFEFKYFLFIKNKILYIVYRNCRDNSFGYCDFALELLDFFIEIWEAKINLNSNLSEDQYISLQNEFKKRYHEYRREYYWNIYEYSEDFNEKEMYEFAKRLEE